MTWISHYISQLSAGCHYSSMPLLRQRFYSTVVELGAWMINYIPYFCVNVIVYLCTKFNAGFVNLCSKNRHQMSVHKYTYISYIWQKFSSLPYTVECHYSAIQFITISHTALAWQRQNINQTLNAQKHLISRPCGRTIRCDLWEFKSKLTALYCIVYRRLI